MEPRPNSHKNSILYLLLIFTCVALVAVLVNNHRYSLSLFPRKTYTQFMIEQGYEKFIVPSSTNPNLSWRGWRDYSPEDWRIVLDRLVEEPESRHTALISFKEPVSSLTLDPIIKERLSDSAGIEVMHGITDYGGPIGWVLQNSVTADSLAQIAKSWGAAARQFESNPTQNQILYFDKLDAGDIPVYAFTVSNARAIDLQKWWNEDSNIGQISTVAVYFDPLPPVKGFHPK